jgi:hypothetical protein
METLIFEHEARYISSKTINSRTVERNGEAVAAFSVTLSTEKLIDEGVTEEKVVIKTKSGPDYLTEPDDGNEYFAVWNYGM